MKNNCTKCTYRRDYAECDPFELSFDWCSNSKSPRFKDIADNKSICEMFYRLGKKAPLWMRVINKILSWIK